MRPSLVPVAGPPGAGKSSALIELSRRAPQLARFGVRDYGLWLAAQGDPLGLAVRGPLQRQELLTDGQVRQELVHFLDHLPEGTRVVAAEGYPRNPRQCDDLVGVARDRDLRIAAFVLLDIPDDVVRQRAANRRLCARCGAPTSSPAAEQCRDCGGMLVRRRDDEATRLALRLADYREVSKCLLAYFRARGLLHVVDGLWPAEDVCQELAGLLGIDAGALL